MFALCITHTAVDTRARKHMNISVKYVTHQRTHSVCDVACRTVCKASLAPWAVYSTSSGSKQVQSSLLILKLVLWRLRIPPTCRVHLPYV